MTLREYRRKRKFWKTPEPSGALRFVVQKHAASRLHYDFRIELDGVLKSWAVPKGPSLNPLDQRLAVQVEDHPLEYGDFEGIIPKGNYGAGKVEIWDYGTYRERNSSGREASEAALRSGLRQGKITLLLDGKRLRGEFALVRLKGPDPRHWLLVKKRDGSADYRATIDEKRLGGRKTALPKSIRPASFVTASELPKDKGWIYEQGEGGTRALARIQKAKPYLPGASKELLARLAKFPDMVLDGELVQIAGKLRYDVFDVLYCEGEDLRKLPLLQRKRRLRSLPIFSGLVRYRPHRLHPMRRGEIVARRADGCYLSGKAADWRKISSVGKRSAPLTSERPAITHADKIYFPDDGYTKGDLIAYYESVAPYLIPHLLGRPLSLHRQPNGIGDPGFYQKDVTGFIPRRVRTARIFSPSSGKTIQYLVCEDAWTLLYLANLGCIEIHPWLSRLDSLDRPDFCVIDLDPDGNSFAEVVKVAREVKRILDRIGAVAFCKTSGASGLHILLPLGARYTFEESREFAEQLCQVLNARLPRLTSVERSPARRRGKIYLDFLQNRRGQTLAAPYSVRPHRGAPVSMPLKWSELSERLKPGDFTIKNTLARLRRRGDVWGKMSRSAIDLSKCLQRLKAHF